MAKDFYNDDAPMPFRNMVEGEPEGEPEVPGQQKRKMVFTGSLLGQMGYPIGYPMGYPMGYPDGPMYPFIMGSAEDYEKDPNP